MAASAKISVLTDAVSVALNAGTFSQTLAIATGTSRSYNPNKRLLALGSIDVVVLPKASVLTQEARDERTKEVSIDIAVRKKVNSDLSADCDPVLILAEEIADFFKFGTVGTTGYCWQETRHEPIFDVQLLQDIQVFFSLITLTFLAADDH